MLNPKLTLFACAALVASNVVLPSPSIAATFTNQTTFLNNVEPGFYLENFNSRTVNVPVNQPLAFSNNGFGYSANVISSNGTALLNPTLVFVDTFGTPALSTNLQNFSSIVINFTSGNVTAVGGNIFTTRASNLPQAEGMTALLNDGTTLAFNSTTTSPGSFVGFTSNIPITSLTIAINNGSNRSPNLDNFYVGSAVPVPFEFSPGLGVLGFGSLWGVNKLHKIFAKR